MNGALNIGVLPDLAEIVIAALILAGGAFALIAAIGVYRMPDALMRLHAGSKAGTLGAGLVLIAAAASFEGGGAAARAIAGIVFLLVTAPAAAHAIGRAAYLSGSPLSPRTWLDERRAAAEASGAPARRGRPVSTGVSTDAAAPEEAEASETRRDASPAMVD